MPQSIMMGLSCVMIILLWLHFSQAKSREKINQYKPIKITTEACFERFLSRDDSTRIIKQYANQTKSIRNKIR